MLSNERVKENCLYAHDNITDKLTKTLIYSEASILKAYEKGTTHNSSYVQNIYARKCNKLKNYKQNNMFHIENINKFSCLNIKAVFMIYALGRCFFRYLWMYY